MPTSSPSTSPVAVSPHQFPAAPFQFKSHYDCDQQASLQQQQAPKMKIEQTVPILPKARTVHTAAPPQSKIVKGAISTEALKAGMRSAVKSTDFFLLKFLAVPNPPPLFAPAYERRKPKAESAANEARALQVEQMRKIEKMESSDDDELGSGNKELLTEEEKRMNHIASEKKRRNNIRVAFETMTDLVPALNGTHFSKATILNKGSISFLKYDHGSLPSNPPFL